MEKAIAILKKTYLFLVLLVTILIFSILSNKFFTVSNLTNIFLQNAYMVVASVGVSMIMICGGADLSVSYQMSLVSLVSSMLMNLAGWPVPLAIVLGLLTGAVLGTINGLCTIKLKIHPMVVTLAMMTVFQGIAYLMSGSKSFYNLPAGFKVIGQGYIFGTIPVNVVIMVVMVALASLILNKTYFGRYLYAIGGNQEAAHLAGINTGVIRVLGFALAGVYIAVSALILTARTGSSNAGIGGDAVFNCITACVLGGISFKGGSGKVSGVVIGVMILGVLANGMQLIGMGVYAQYVAKGLILLLAIALDNYQKNSTVKHAKDVAKAETIKASGEQ